MTPRHSIAARWLHAGLAAAVMLGLGTEIIMQAPRGGHPGNLFYPLNLASDWAALVLAGLLLAARPRGHRGLLALVFAMAASGLLADFGDLVTFWHGALCALVAAALAGHVLAVLLRHYGRDDGLAEMWSLRKP